MQKTNFATFISSAAYLPPPPPKPKPPSKWGQKIAKEGEQLHDLQHELKVTRLKGDIHEAKARIQPQKSERELVEESLQRFFDRNIGAEESARKMKAMIDIQFENDPDGRERRYAIIDAWLRDRM